MAEEKKDYREEMFNNLADVIENTGKDDKGYDGLDKARDILEVLESLLAFAIYNTSISEETIKQSAEESHTNIREGALDMLKRHGMPQEEE